MYLYPSMVYHKMKRNWFSALYCLQEMHIHVGKRDVMHRFFLQFCRFNLQNRGIRAKRAREGEGEVKRGRWRDRARKGKEKEKGKGTERNKEIEQKR